MGGEATKRLPLRDAEWLARELVDRLEPWCERCEIAGSIRRRRPDVGDVELVVVPCLVPGPPDLLGTPQGTINLLDTGIRLALDDGDAAWALRPDTNGRTAYGERYKRLAYRGVAVDLFSVLPPAQWGVLLTIRTGPAAFSHRLVTSRLLGGWLPAGMQVRDGALLDGGRLVETPEEADFFAACGLPFLPPEQRTDTVRAVRWRSPRERWAWVDGGGRVAASEERA